ncbi:uncharacterized protein A4U43_UnF8720 [Asparagus officinalis]|uniref:4-hydroxy-7-methoxy-3-oxo-3,4-dihydro-2H-1,4-benzoxazin-2-yl glucosidebeta-D-glucosidase n=1 Tax=Asparagus officinalis TaxID=4686 RepID=A0A1R3L5W0_ASPOF|nr:uncharacterized protein A4U43_UnF8720 [Asparagus officinalis]
MKIPILFSLVLLAVRCSAAVSAGPIHCGLNRAAFPEGFTFGSAASAYQVEGMALKEGRGPSSWDVFVHVPGNIANNDTADRTADEYHRYKVRR